MVEDERGKVFASCSEVPRDGMVIYTNTPRLQHHRKMIIELLLSSHCRDCTTCAKNGVCTLQKLASQLGISEIRFENHKKPLPLDTSSDCVIRDPNKCILCGDCVRTCDEIQGLGILDFAFRGSKMQVMPAFNRELAETDCVGCGQCRAVCPTGAISIRQDVDPVWKALADKNIRVVAQIAPAVRWRSEINLESRKVKIHWDAWWQLCDVWDSMRVYDTNFGADLTVMEESAELLERLKSGKNLPLFTSCCPGWVKFCENRYPEFRENISTCRSPQAMFGALLKEEARMKAAEAEKRRTEPPQDGCDLDYAMYGKKAEIKRPEHFTEGQQDVDYVLTTTEVTRMIKEAGMDLSQIEPEALDMPFGLSSGAAAIFGVTGGVTEAVLRRLVHSSRMEDLQDISFTGIRGIEGIKEASIQLEDRTVKIAVVNGLRCAETLLERIKAGEVQYDFVEVMACKRGCIAGGGQPVPIGPRTKQARLDGMYKIDSMAQIKRSDENPIIAEVYEGILKGKEHKLLHNR